VVRKRKGREKLWLALAIVISISALMPSVRASIVCNNCSDCCLKIQNASLGDIIKLTADITNHDGTCIVFNGSDGITFDCDSHTISGEGQGIGIYLDDTGDGSNHNVIKNCVISGFNIGIKVDHSRNNNVTDVISSDNHVGGVYMNYADNNNLINVSASGNKYSSGNNYGFKLRYSSYNTLTDVVAEDTKGSVAWGGFYLEHSNYNNFTNIVASDNTRYGIYIRWSSNHNRIRNATITTYGNQGGLNVYSHSGQSTKNDIDTSNTINGNPIQFFDNYYKPCPNDQVLDYNDTYSLVHFYGCNNVTLYATTMEDSVFLWSTSNSKIYNVNASYAREGIRIWQSNSNTFTNITTSHNSNSGFYIDSHSNHNKFINITSSYNSNGVYANTADNNVFTNVIVSNNTYDGFYIRHSDYNTFTNVTVSDNNDDGIEFVFNSDYNTVNNSCIEKNLGAGLYFYESDSNDPEYNLIYNNLLNNTVNLEIEEGIPNPNYLNSSLNCSGVMNIIGGQCIGGNFWAYPDGTGWSQICADVAAPFGICDEYYDLTNGVSVAIDWLPLAGNDSSGSNVSCASCSDCSQKIASASAGEVVRLVIDITNQEDSCIVFNGIDNITFDCGGHAISGDADDDGYGILLNNSNDNTIKNCLAINQFHSGIYLYNADNNTVTGITVDNNQEGMHLFGNSRYNTIKNTRIKNNTDYGIYLNAFGSHNPRYNTFYNNYFNNSYNAYSNNDNNENDWNTTLDCSSTDTNIIDKRCIGGNFWADPDGTGWSQTCADIDEDGICDTPYYVQTNNTDYLPLTGDFSIKDCINCTDCSEKIALVSAGGTVRLISNITNQDGTCILIPRSDVTFDCQNHLIDGDNDWEGYGIYVDASSYGDINNVTIRNCNIRQFDDGIYLDGSSSYVVENSSIVDTTVSDNRGHGIDLANAPNNILTGIKSCLNDNDGIMIRDSSYNRLENIETNSNGQCGIYLLFSSSSYNSLTNITSSSNGFAGIYIDRCSSTTVNNSHITNNNYGINLNSAGANLIYNNFFCNDNNIGFRGTEHANDWNVTNTTGPNIVGGPFIGGNYWLDYKGIDENDDGFGDMPYNITGESNKDYLPLFNPPDIRIDPTTLNIKISQALDSKVGAREMLMHPPQSQPTEPIDRIVIDGRPPEIFRAPAVSLPEPRIAAGINILPNVPAFDWSYGCFATAAAMMMGYYDNNGYPDMYTGPSNGGVCPLNNSLWGHEECPLSATHQGIDGRSERGHVDNYWISYGSGGPDPYVANSWTQHTWGDCTADFMGTNQYKFGSTDGVTWFWYYRSGAPMYDYYAGIGEQDGCYGMRRFVESRGYIVLENFNQLIYGYGGNLSGFTFDNYTAEIDAGRPVIIQVTGHSMLGFGYDNSTGQQTIYIHDTWDHNDHAMQWGGSYHGHKHYGVTVMRLAPANSSTRASVFSIIEDDGKPLPIDSISKNESWITLEHPDTSFGMVGYGQRAVIVRVDGTQAVGGDSDVITITSNDPDESPYPDGVTVNVWMCGDVESNGDVNWFDYVTLRAYVLEAPGWTVESNWTADVDGNGDVNWFDYVTLRAYVLEAPSWVLNCS
jgi:parallel beta-helix repeat protein